MRSSNGSGSTAKRSRALATSAPPQPGGHLDRAHLQQPGQAGEAGPGLGLEHGHVADHHPSGVWATTTSPVGSSAIRASTSRLLLGGAHEGVDAGVDLEPAQQRARAAVAQHQRPLGGLVPAGPRLPARQPGRAPARLASG